MKLSTNEKIRRYCDAYYDLHGSYPSIKKSGSWLYINNSMSAIRASELIPRTQRLIEMKRDRQRKTQIKKREDYWYVDEPITITIPKTNNKPWEGYIKEDLIDMFLYKIFENCENSIYEMEQCMKDFTYSNTSRGDLYKFGGITEEIKKLRSEYEKRIEYMMLKHERELKDKIIENLKLSNKIRKLRENSVLFTMEDLDAINITKKTSKSKPKYKKVKAGMYRGY